MLINCTVYQQGRKLADIPTERIAEYLDLSDTFIWVALTQTTQEELTGLKNIFGIHELAIEDAVKEHQRPKIEEYDDDLFVTLHLVGEVHGELKINQASLFAGANYIVTIHGSHSEVFEGARKRCEREPKMLAKGPGYVLYALIDAVVDSYFPLIEKLEAESEALEERIFTRGAGRSNIFRLYKLKRKTMTLRHAVAPLMEAVGNLQSGRVPPLCVNMRAYFRDVYDHLTRITASVDSIRDTISTAIQVNLSLVTIDQTEISKRLAAWAGIFAVATAFAGIWGMNFVNMPELQWRYGYPLSLAAIAASCVFLYWRFKKAGWL